MWNIILLLAVIVILLWQFMSHADFSAHFLACLDFLRIYKNLIKVNINLRKSPFLNAGNFNCVKIPVISMIKCMLIIIVAVPLSRRVFKDR